MSLTMTWDGHLVLFWKNLWAESDIGSDFSHGGTGREQLLDIQVYCSRFPAFTTEKFQIFDNRIASRRSWNVPTTGCENSKYNQFRARKICEGFSARQCPYCQTPALTTPPNIALQSAFQKTPILQVADPPARLCQINHLAFSLVNESRLKRRRV